jgi:ABC-type uncharacterized transport system ATPase subunit
MRKSGTSKKRRKKNSVIDAARKPWALAVGSVTVSAIIALFTYGVLKSDSQRQTFSSFILVPAGLILPIVGYWVATKDSRFNRLVGVIPQIKPYIDAIDPKNVRSARNEIGYLRACLTLSPPSEEAAISIAQHLGEKLQVFADEREIVRKKLEDAVSESQRLLRESGQGNS